MIDFGSNEEFIANYQRLKSSRKMGELYGCNKGSITAHAKKIGYDYSNNKESKITTTSPEEVYEKYLELKGCPAVGKFYGCSSTAVRNYLLKAGYELNSPWNKLANLTDEEFIIKYEELQTADAMAKEFNCSSTAVSNRIHRLGLPIY